MSKAFRSLLTLTLGLTLAVPQSGALQAPAGARYPAMPLLVTPEAAHMVAQMAGDPEAALKRLLPDVSPAERGARLKSMAGGVLKGGNAVLQFNALVILFAVMSFQATKEQRDFMRLSGQSASASTGEEGLCKDHSPATEMLCSGEFYLGSLTVAGLLAGNKVLDFVIRRLLKDSTKRVPFLNVIGAFVGTGSMLFGGAAAGFLWGEAVKALPSEDMIKKAHGIAGRALLYRQSWASFKETEDGQIFGKILENMNNILLVDQELRDQWFYNTWRFGIARGEFVAAMGTLMSAEVIGQLATAAAVALGASAGTAAPAIGFMVCAGVGTYMLYEVLGSEAPKKFTALMQHARALNANSNLKNAREEIRYYAQYLKGPKSSSAPTYHEYFRVRIQETFERAQGSREDYVNVQLEKFHELYGQLRGLESKVAIAKFVLTKTDLAKNIYMDVDGKYLTVAQAQKRACGSTAFCDLSINPQLEALEKYPPILDEGNQQLARYAYRITRVYQTDLDFLNAFKNDATVSYPFAIASVFNDQLAKMTGLSQLLTITLAALSPVFNRTARIDFTDDQREIFARDLGIYYTQRYSEQKTFKDLQQVAEVAVEN